MPFQKGHTLSRGNKGGGRPSVKDTIWHKTKWEVDSIVKELESKIASGKYSVREMFLLQALKGDKEMLKVFANKNLADLHELSTVVEHVISDEDKEVIKHIFPECKD